MPEIMKSRKLIIKVEDPENGCKESQFEVWEFSNGAILVPGESTNDYFFNNLEEITPNGNDVVINIQSTEETADWSNNEIFESIKGSYREFGTLEGVDKIIELFDFSKDDIINGN